MAGQTESTWRIGPGTMMVIVAALVSGGIWLGTLQAQVTGLRTEVEATKADHAALMTKLEQVDARIAGMQLDLGKEVTKQSFLHRGQMPEDK